MSAAILQLRHDELRRVDADRRQLAHRPVRLGNERGEHVAGGDRVQRRRDENRHRRFRRVALHRVLPGDRIGDDVREGTIVANRAGENKGHLVHHARVHDAVLDDALLHGVCDRPRGAYPVDRTHMETVTARRRFAGARHSQRRTEDRRLDVVHRDSVAGE